LIELLLQAGPTSFAAAHRARERADAVMHYHVTTPAETQLAMQTEAGHVVRVLPAPPSSLPPAVAPAPSAPNRRARSRRWGCQGRGRRRTRRP